MPSDVDIAWCAGVFEGRGSFGTFYDEGKARFQMYINAPKDVVDRFHAIVGGHIRHEAEEKISRDRWEWWTSGNATETMTLFWPYLSEKHIQRARMAGFKPEGT
jgi:hypothetical protein